MSHRWLTPLVLPFLACSQPKKAEDPHARFITHMDSVELESAEILKDLKSGRGRPAVVGRLDAIRKHLESAESVKYRKDPAENEEMSRYFATFYSKLEQFRKEDWSGENGGRLWDKMQFQCSVCHGRFRD